MSGNSPGNDEKLESFLDAKQVDSDAMDAIEDAAKEGRRPRSMTGELLEKKARFRSRCRWSAVAVLCIVLSLLVAQRIRIHNQVMSEVAKLNDPDVTVRVQAAQALRDFGPAAKAAVPALVEAAKDEKVGWARSALESIGPSGKWALPQLIEGLTDEDPQGRAVAAFAIGCIGPKAREAVPNLIESLQDPLTRAEAARALAKIGPSAKAAVPALVETTKDEQAWVRVWAADAIWRIDQDPRAIPVLIDVLKSHYASSTRAATSLGNIGPSAKEAVPALIEHCVRFPSDGTSRAALERIGLDVEAVPYLIRALGHPKLTDHRRELFITWLKKIGPPAVPELIEAAKSQHARQSQAAFDALRRIDPKAAAKLDLKRSASKE
ncbi:MAG: HEAT repeat domain-containing protein [Planctomycetes bacterium]|nr:HEAT repeat domain-containing protein [Planctomycetota bacterium]MBL7044801.1 HEAT repeat domain-containing protein [Pirellulaceae bacterium]